MAFWLLPRPPHVTLFNSNVDETWQNVHGFSSESVHCFIDRTQSVTAQSTFKKEFVFVGVAVTAAAACWLPFTGCLFSPFDVEQTAQTTNNQHIRV